MEIANERFSLKTIRIHRGMTLEEAAELMGVTPRTILNYENGTTSPNLRKALALSSIYRFPIQMIDFNQQRKEE